MINNKSGKGTSFSDRKNSGPAAPSFGRARYPVIKSNNHDKHRPFPLSDIQESFLAGRQIDPSDKAGCHIYIELYENMLDIGRLNSAWYKLIQHHEMLRTKINHDGTQQLIEQQPVYQIKVFDYRSHDRKSIRQVIQDVRNLMSHKAYSAFDWPLFEIVLSQISDTECVVHFSIDELIVDGASLYMLVDQWFKLYEDPSYRLEPLPISFRDYQLATQAFKSSEKYNNDLVYWVRKLVGANLDFGRTQVPKNLRERMGGVVLRKRYDYTLSAREWGILKERAKVLNVYSTTMLITIFSDVISSLCDTESFPVTLTYYNRPSVYPQLNQVVGPFISTSIFLADSDQSRTFKNRLLSNQQQLWDDLDHSSVSGVRCLREVSKYQKSHISIPIVFTSFLGLFGKEMPRWLNESNYMITQTPQISLDHQVVERDGALYISWDVVEHDFGENVIQKMFERFCHSLRLVANNTDKWDSTELQIDSYEKQELGADMHNHCGADETNEKLEAVCRADALCDKYEVAGDLELTDQQRAYLFSRVAEGDAGACQLYQEFVSNRVDVDRLESVIDRLINAHTMLRAVMHQNGKQHILTKVPDYKITVFDFASLDEDERRLRLLETRNRLKSGLFNLGEWPFFSVCVSHTGADESIIHCTVDLLIADGDSIHYLFSQMCNLYLNPGKSVLEPQVTFKQYIGALSGFLKLTNQSKAAAYWDAKFKEFAPGPALVALKPDPGTQNSSAHVRLSRSFDSWSNLQTKASRYGVSLNAVLLSAYGRVLLEYNDTEDLSVVVPLWQHRNLHKDVDSLVGDFTSLSWVSVATEQSAVLSLIQTIDRVLSDDLRYGVIDTLQALRKSSRQAGGKQMRFPVVFTGLMPRAHYPVNGDIVLGYGETRTPGVVLDCVSVEVAGVGHISWDVDCGSLCPDKTDRMLDRYLEVLEFLAQEETVWESAGFDSLTTSGMSNRHVPWVSAAVKAYPVNACLHQYIEQQVANAPDLPAVCLDGASLSYAQLNRNANIIAHSILNSAIVPGSVVAILVERSFEMVTGLLATLKAGCAYLPLDPSLPRDRIAYILKDASVDVVLTTSSHMKLLNKFDGYTIDFHTLGAGNTSDHNPVCRVTQDNLAYIIYTSGSTGNPKGCAIAHKAICNRLFWMKDRYPIGFGDSVLQKTPFSFDVSVWEFFWPLMVGARIVLAKPGGHKDSAYLATLINEEQINVCHFVPSMLAYFLSEPASMQCHSLKHVFVSGEALSYDLMIKFMRTLSARLHNLYGPTEAAVDVTYWECSDREDKIVPIGRAISNIQIYILDDTLAPVTARHIGEIYIGGVGLAEGYVNQPELTSERFIDNPFVSGECLYKTGDLGRQLNDGNIEYLGRIDSQVKLRGFRVELGEVEHALREYPCIDEVVVDLKGGATNDPRLVAYCIVNRSEEFLAKSIRRFLKGKLPEYMVPNLFVSIDTLPVTAHGKLDRKQLPWPVQDVIGAAGGLESTGADDTSVHSINVASEVLMLVQRIIGIEKLGMHDDLFECGATSLTLINISQALNETLGVEVSGSDFVDDFMGSPTIDWIVNFIETKIKGATSTNPGRAAVCTQATLVKEKEENSSSSREDVIDNISTIFSSTLTVTVDDPCSDLFDLGATSLSLINVCREISRRYKINISMSDMLEDFMDTPTVEWVAEYVLNKISSTASIVAQDSSATTPPAVCQVARGQPTSLRTEDRCNESDSIQLASLQFDQRYYKNNYPNSVDGDVALPWHNFSSLVSQLSAKEIEGSKDAKFMFPHAGGMKCVQTYVYVREGQVEGIEQGVYYFHPYANSLFLVDSTNLDHIFSNATHPAAQDFSKVGFCIVFVAQLNALSAIYQNHSHYLATLDAGYMTQLLMSKQEECSVGVAPVDGIYFEDVRDSFKLDDGHHFINCLFAGRLGEVSHRNESSSSWSGFGVEKEGRGAPSNETALSYEDFINAVDLSTLTPMSGRQKEVFGRAQYHLRKDTDFCLEVKLDKCGIITDKFTVRASHRIYQSDVVPLVDFGRFMSLLKKRTLDGGSFYLFPASQGRYVIETYVYVKPDRVEGVSEGIYYYDADRHALDHLTLNLTVSIESAHVPFNRKHFKSSSFSIFFIARTNNARSSLGDTFVHNAMLEAGAIGQTLMDHQAEFGLGLCPIGGLNFDRIKADFKLNQGDLLIHHIVGGRVDREGMDVTINSLDTEDVQLGAEVGRSIQLQEIVSRDLAIIGISGRYPGADSLEQFWDNLVASRRSFSNICDERTDILDIAVFQDRQPSIPSQGGYLNHIDTFDNLLFNISPLEAVSMDPQERLFLEVAWECLENAGYTAASMVEKSSDVGVFVGAMWGDYSGAGLEDWHGGGDSLGKSLHSDIANRVSYFFDFNGPSMSIGTSCSSSLTSVHLGCESILRGECSVVLVGGVNIISHPYHIALLEKNGLLTKSGVSNAFGQDGNGWVIGEGVGAVLIKPLADAVKDGDHIHGVIKGTGIYHSGKSLQYGAANSKSQCKSIQNTLERSGVDQERVSYVESSATGAGIADASEINAIVKSMAGGSGRPCAIGSVKPNIGHLESASGMSQLTKVLLQMKHRKLVPTIDSEPQNPLIQLDETRFSINRDLRNWDEFTGGGKEATLTALVNNFGASGSCAHVLLESYPNNPVVSTDDGDQLVFVLSAETDSQLKEYAARLKAFVLCEECLLSSFKDIACTLHTGRVEMECRLAVVAATRCELADLLGRFIDEEHESLDNIVTGCITGSAEAKNSLMDESPDPMDKARCWVSGGSVDWGYGDDRSHKKVPLPTYPFKKTAHWPDPVSRIGHVDVQAHSISRNNDDLALLSATQSYLKEVFSSCSGVSISQIGAEVTLDRYGINSLLITKMKSKLEDDLGKIPSSVFFEFNTIKKLSTYFIQNHYHDLQRSLGGSQEQAQRHEEAEGTSGISDSTTSHSQESSHGTNSAPASSGDVAVIGIGCRYPNANNLDEYWDNLKSGKDCISEMPSDRPCYQQFWQQGTNDAALAHVRKGGFISDVDRFDPLFFNISPSWAELMDPQERLFLEVAWQTMEDAGYSLDSLHREYHGKVGVFVGVMYNEYQMYGPVIEGESIKAASPGYGSIANRVSFHFGLNGPSMAVDTMCSSSLTSLHLAIESVKRGECKAAFVGGANLLIHPNKSILHSHFNMLSKDGRCKSFGQGGDGFVPGEGVGAVMIKPLAQAEADGDHIYGIIKGTAINHDGESNGYTVPNPKAQRELIAGALSSTQIDPRTISYIEAHGTGTALGDPIELEGLTAAFNLPAEESQFCAIGSVKSNIGHLESAAGLAALTKVLLQLEHKQLVPSLHAENMNESIDFETTPFYVQQTLSEWGQPKGSVAPRRAGISSFGAGGSNAHVILEEYIPGSLPNQTKPIAGGGKHAFVLSAVNRDALRRYGTDLERFIADSIGPVDGVSIVPDGQELWIEDVLYTLQVGRDAMDERLAIVVSDLDELSVKLAAYLAGDASIDEGCFTGNIRRIGDGDQLYGVDGSVAADMVSLLLDKGDVESLAKLWVNGVDVEWGKLYRDGIRRRVALPTYPFADERYWIPADESEGEALAPSANAIHPLVEQNISTLRKQKFVTRFTGDEFFLIDHLVNGHAVLPGVIQLEMARAAVEVAAESIVYGMTDVMWISPVRVKGGEVDVYISLYPDDACVNYEITTIDQSGVQKLHSKGCARLDEDFITGSRKVVDMAAVREHCTVVVSPSEFYAGAVSMGLDYGPCFQAVAELYCGSDEVFARLKAVESSAGQQSQYLLPPSIIDAALQSTFALALVQKQEMDRLFLPLSVAEIKIVGEVGKARYAHSVLVDGGVESGRLKYDVTIVDEAGNPVVLFNDFVLTASTGVEEEPHPQDVDLPLTNYFVSKWIADSNLGDEPGNVNFSGGVLICDYSAGLSDKFKAVYGHEDTVLVKPGAEFKQLDTHNYEIDPLNEVDFKLLISRLEEDGFDVAHILYNWSDQLESIAKSCREYEEVLNFYPLFNLAKALFVVCPAKEIQLSYLFKGNGAQHTAIGGFFRSVHKENQHFVFKILGFDMDVDDEHVLSAIGHETGCGSKDDVEVYYDQTRYIRQTIEAEVLDSKEEPVPLRQNGTYIITGGLGGLGLLFAEYFAKNYSANLVLVGRSALNESKRAKINTIASLGVEVHYIQADVSRRQDCTKIIEESKQLFSHIDGIIHGAGETRDSLIVNKTPEEIDAVIRPKVFGTVNLDEASKDETLDFFVLFSSIVSILGNAGQCDYAYANAFLDGYSEHRDRLRKAGQRVGITKTINWPYWESGGMSLDQTSLNYLERAFGTIPLNTDKGMVAFEKSLNVNAHNVIVVDGFVNKVRRAFYVPGAEGRGHQPALATIAGDYSQEDLKEKIRSYLTSLVAVESKLTTDKIDTRDTLDRYGIDSVMILNITRILERDLGEIPSTMFFEHQTIDALTEYMAGNYRSQFNNFFRNTSGDAGKPSIGEDSERLAGLKQVYALRQADRLPNKRQAEIAIVGISGRYPQASDLNEFWRNLESGKDCISEIPSERWNYKPYYDPEANHSFKSYTKWGGFIDDVDKFDPLFFKIPPAEAKLVDPQQRLFLETVYSAIEDAGYTRNNLCGAPDCRDVGVFVGTMWGDYGFYGIEGFNDRDEKVPQAPHWAIANRISYFFDFHGPSIAIDTACSSSLTAIHMAVESIQKGECCVAVAGGVNLSLHPVKYQILSQDKFASHDGKCRSFGEGGTGYVPGEGVGAVILKPLDKAIEDGDQVYCVIKSSAINHGGKTNGFTVPNPKAQAELIVKAITEGKVDPRQISYIEAHGTGTTLGDPIEIAGLTNAFRRFVGDETQFCSIGSVKSNIGHLEAAAGIAGLSKIILQLKKGKLVPSIHSAPLNAKIDLENSPFYIQREVSDWIRPRFIKDGVEREWLRMAAISSFGAGGANAHLILEEYEDAFRIQAADSDTPGPQLFILSAKQSDQLLQAAVNLHDFLIENPDVDLLNVSYTLQVGREHFSERLAVVAENADQLLAELGRFVNEGDIPEGFFINSSISQDSRDSIIGSGQNESELIRTLYEGGHFDDLAILWVTGSDVDWATLRDVASDVYKRVSLPTYPFARDLCRVDVSVAMSDVLPETIEEV